MSQSQNGFSTLGIAPRILDALERLKYTEPTPIQAQAIPAAIEGKDLVGIAQTGTGKTLAFALPIMQRLASIKGQGLVILPTRELALQVDETFQKVGRSFGLRTAILIGGQSMKPQLNALHKKPHVIIGTPGRILDHMQQKTLSLSQVNVLVLDEADRMLDMGFAPQITKILREVPRKRQTLLFSATMPDNIVKIAKQYMELPIRVEIARAGTTAKDVTQELYVVTKDQKRDLLNSILSDNRGSVLVFSRTKHGARKICRSLNASGFRAAEIHSNRSLNQRREALDGFKSGKYRVLVATDIASRGIDVKGIELVVNYDLPEQAEDYVHRIGRTGRAGMPGRAITFTMPDQGDKVREIEHLIRAVIKISKLPANMPQHRVLQEPQGGRPSGRPRGGRRPFGGQRSHRRRR